MQGLAQNRGKKLSEVSVFFLFEGDAEEEDSWAMEKLRALESLPIPRDSRQAEMYQQKAKVRSEKLIALVNSLCCLVVVNLKRGSIVHSTG